MTKRKKNPNKKMKIFENEVEGNELINEDDSEKEEKEEEMSKQKKLVN